MKDSSRQGHTKRGTTVMMARRSPRRTRLPPRAWRRRGVRDGWPSSGDGPRADTPYTCDASTPAIVGTYRGAFDGSSSTQEISLQFAQPKKIGVMAGSYAGTSFSYSNIYYEFVSGQSWFGLRPFADSEALLTLFKLQSMDQLWFDRYGAAQ
ncbi:hypothetical protein Pmar_PMAR024569 [Perkinsus marinus ATCC 50983]|uniref:Uncharacterized protein n=1 Tax=Perkinsus marinus (strain ATCC 50983 / TXsc) TaxID=423536 RepID=C5LTC1_PERM5|nr:hypothetical protein Pmar_PMAR024569 [Perkinsus marinus ATCC 50983]EER00089.1 hypothetical protein Pmar_PMAR024569 [Perkinsus marinus ATCC 50983]|eukprot:XP_002767371.1 hypothetical protein Pmar_PMAR024569 [Perkinsus marinus ATCC 50983]